MRNHMLGPGDDIWAYFEEHFHTEPVHAEIIQFLDGVEAQCVIRDNDLQPVYANGFDDEDAICKWLGAQAIPVLN